MLKSKHWITLIPKSKILNSYKRILESTNSISFKYRRILNNLKEFWSIFKESRECFKTSKDFGKQMEISNCNCHWNCNKELNTKKCDHGLPLFATNSNMPGRSSLSQRRVAHQHYNEYNRHKFHFCLSFRSLFYWRKLICH